MRQENNEGNNYLYLEECGKALRRKCHSVGLHRKNSSSLGSQAGRWNCRQREGVQKSQQVGRSLEGWGNQVAGKWNWKEGCQEKKQGR